jgi:hypothetical protein
MLEQLLLARRIQRNWSVWGRALEDVAAMGSGVVEEVGGSGEVDVLLSMLGSP